MLLLHILALHTKRLTRRDLLGLLDVLEGTMGFNPGRFRALASLGEFGLSSRNIMLQGLAFLHGILELLLDLLKPGLVLLTSGLFLGSFLLGLGQGLFKDLTSVTAPTNIITLRSIHIIHSFRIYSKSQHTLLVLQLPSYKVELFFGLLQTLL